MTLRFSRAFREELLEQGYSELLGRLCFGPEVQQSPDRALVKVTKTSDASTTTRSPASRLRLNDCKAASTPLIWTNWTVLLIALSLSNYPATGERSGAGASAKSNGTERLISHISKKGYVSWNWPGMLKDYS